MIPICVLAGGFWRPSDTCGWGEGFWRSLNCLLALEKVEFPRGSMGVEARALSVVEVVGREGTKGCPFIDQDGAPKK